jgi:ppGpp synthetase/RelA/SpoT-type nucleotidyltranferase
MSDDISAWLKDQVTSYVGQEQPIYSIYAEVMKTILRRACNTAAPEASVEARVKAVSSFAEKAVRKRQKYDKPVFQLTDLCGARVITDTQEEVERICQFIRKNFIIDEANSDDKAVLLGTSQFGYRSVHFVVQLPEALQKSEGAQAIGERRAEIQVRTGLQNAWARLAHDRIYKSEFNVPDSIKREMNRAAALLEEADRDFTLILDSLELYSTNQTALSASSQAENEIQTLEMISKNVASRDERERLAIRIALVARMLSDWEKVITILEPFSKEGDPVVLRELGAAICRKNHKNMDSREYGNGISLLEQALKQDPKDAEAHAYLAWSLETTKEERSRNHYADAYQLKPHNPYYLMAYLEFQIAVERKFAGLSLLRPALEAAIETCRKHAAAGIETFKAQFTEAKLLLLLNRPYPALSACTRGIYNAAAAGRVVLENTLNNQLRSIQRLRHVKSDIQGHHRLEQIIRLAFAAYFDGSSLPDTEAFPTKNLNLRKPIIILAGGSDVSEISSQEVEYLQFVFRDFPGTILCGAIHAGTSEVVGSMMKPDTTFCSVGYHPKFLPAGMQLDKRHSERVQTEGRDFSPDEPLQMWTDLLNQGIYPKDVRLLGIEGGEIAALEYQIALALGAEVGVVAGSGGAADDLSIDPFLRRAKNIRVPPMEKLKVEWLDAAAREVHEKYRHDNKERIVVPSMLPWEKLSEALREVNRYQASYITEVLRFAGFGVRPAQGTANDISFSNFEVELMAEMEHGRWNVERLRAGWSLGPRDDANKRTPDLIPWSELSDEVRHKDRSAVAGFPKVLEAAGLEIYRLPKPESH